MLLTGDKLEVLVTPSLHLINLLEQLPELRETLHIRSLKVKAAQLCPTLFDPMVYTVHGILQSRILEWVAFPLSRRSSQPRDRTQVSCMWADSLTAEPQGKPRILEWVAYPFSSRSSQPRNQTGASCMQVDSLPTELSGKPFNKLGH